MTKTDLNKCLNKASNLQIFTQLKVKCEDEKYYSIELVDSDGIINSYFDSKKFLGYIKKLTGKK
ncbi:MAG: hypothetical protein KDK54_19590 [Leptospiraceae bacterium]|nr:hypothetical protein [Leptospiraceae bacterium]